MSSILNSINSGNLQVTPRDKPVKKDSITELLKNSGTGFSKNQDLHYETKCKLPEFKTPLYQENYLQEFTTEEEKAAARHALGIYNKNDVFKLSLLSIKEQIPSIQELDNSPIKQLCQNDVLFTPVTQFKAVFDSSGRTLDSHINELTSLLTRQQEELYKINLESNLNDITSLGDVRVFLKGFNNGENLHTVLDKIDQETIRFENIGQIN